MKPRLAIAFVTALMTSSSTFPVPSAARSCHRPSSHNCFRLPASLDFSSVPEISNAVVGDAPKLRAAPKPMIDPQPAARPYTGPMIGVDSRVGAPTVGYYWSIH
jgi:hypothetical protein